MLVVHPQATAVGKQGILVSQLVCWQVCVCQAVCVVILCTQLACLTLLPHWLPVLQEQDPIMLMYLLDLSLHCIPEATALGATGSQHMEAVNKAGMSTCVCVIQGQTSTWVSCAVSSQQTQMNMPNMIAIIDMQIDKPKL